MQEWSHLTFNNVTLILAFKWYARFTPFSETLSEALYAKNGLTVLDDGIHLEIALPHSVPKLSPHLTRSSST